MGGSVALKKSALFSLFNVYFLSALYHYEVNKTRNAEAVEKNRQIAARRKFVEGEQFLVRSAASDSLASQVWSSSTWSSDFEKSIYNTGNIKVNTFFIKSLFEKSALRFELCTCICDREMGIFAIEMSWMFFLFKPLIFVSEPWEVWPRSIFDPRGKIRWTRWAHQPLWFWPSKVCCRKTRFVNNFPLPCVCHPMFQPSWGNFIPWGFLVQN